MLNSRSFFIFSFVCILVLASNSAYAQVTRVTASVDKNTALIDESIRLSVIATGEADRSEVNFGSLQNNFRVSQPSFSQSTQIVNGSMTRTVSWTVNLYPKSVGTFTIPSFTIQGQQSLPFSIKVLPVDAANSQGPREFYVTAEIDNDTIYLQQQVLYKVKIHLARDIQRGQLSLPELEGAVVEQIGEDKDYQDIIDGVRYRIIERSYAIIPQASGEFTVTGPIFDAEVPTDSRRSFANFGRTKTISRRAPNIEIDVKPMPNNYQYTWLPSELVEVEEEWQGNKNEMTVGEPVTRTITLSALGLTKEQLPEIDQPFHPSFKIYPEQPNLTTVEVNNSLVAQGVFNSAIIPESVGDFVLPEIRIPWFNVNTGTTEFAVVPARSISVVANTNSQNDVAPVTRVDEPLEQAQADPVLISTEDAWWEKLAYILIATNIVTLVLFILVLVKRASNKRIGSAKSDEPQSTLSSLTEAQAFSQLKSSLEKGKSDSLTEELNTWLLHLLGKQHYSVSASLALEPDSQALNKYNEFLKMSYSPNSSSADYAQFIQALQNYRDTFLKNSKPRILDSLYPHS